MTAIETKIAFVYVLAFIPIVYLLIKGKRSPALIVLGSSLAFASSFVVRASVESMEGYPTSAMLPDRLELVGFHANPPGPQNSGKTGLIYVFGTSRDASSDGSWLRYAPQDAEPRSYALPFSLELLDALKTAMQAKESGELLEMQVVDTENGDGNTPGQTQDNDARRAGDAEQDNGEGMKGLLEEAQRLVSEAEKSTQRQNTAVSTAEWAAGAIRDMSAQVNGAARAARSSDVESDLRQLAENLDTLRGSVGAYAQKLQGYLSETKAAAKSAMDSTASALDDFNEKLGGGEYGAPQNQRDKLVELFNVGYELVLRTRAALKSGEPDEMKQVGGRTGIAAKQFETAAGMTDSDMLSKDLATLGERLDVLSRQMIYAVQPNSLERRRSEVEDDSAKVLESISALSEKMQSDPRNPQSRGGFKERTVAVGRYMALRIAAIPRQNLPENRKQVW